MKGDTTLSMSLRGFMADRAEQVQTVRTVVSGRFVDDDGQPLEWETRALSGDEDCVLRKKHQKFAPVAGRTGEYRQEFDTEGYISELAARSTVFPNLNDRELQDSYGVMGADDLLRTMLLAGEYQGYLETVQQINAFMTSGEEVALAKK